MHIVLPTFKLIAFFLITLILIPVFIIGKYLKVKLPNLKIDTAVKHFWSRLGLWLCNLSIVVEGKNFMSGDVYVSNHISWLDILVFQSLVDLSFLAKSEVRGWIGFGFLARLVDTVFVERKVMAAKKQQNLLLQQLIKRKKICFFPEGTSSSGQSILPFKSSLFEVFVKCKIPNQDKGILIQPVTLQYTHSDLTNPLIYAWWGDMTLVPHIFKVLAFGKQGIVKVIFHEVIDTNFMTDRKVLCRTVQKKVSSVF